MMLCAFGKSAFSLCLWHEWIYGFKQSVSTLTAHNSIAISSESQNIPLKTKSLSGYCYEYLLSELYVGLKGYYRLDSSTKFPLVFLSAVFRSSLFRSNKLKLQE